MAQMLAIQTTTRTVSVVPSAVLHAPTLRVRPRTASSRACRLRVSAALGDDVGDQKETSRAEQGSYGAIESPVRGTVPDGQGNVEDRIYGATEQMTSPEFNQDTKLFGTKIGILDAMRFNGALPEIANSRLAMLGFFAALIAEATTGKNVFQQVGSAPLPIAALFLTIIVATAVPILRGNPRKGNALFSSNAELINGRIAMLAFTSIVAVTGYTGSYLGSIPFLH